ncbi:MAG: hypothetical protein LC650_02685, partial [Actinobacteria bacterium]|nr:hypothetical protein [Actinomycetota bacterium]
IGEYTMLGMEQGIISKGQQVVDAVSRVAGEMTGAFNPQLDAAMNIGGGYGNAYSGASGKFTSMRADKARASSTMIEVPVYLHGREIARASNDEQKRMNRREDARQAQFSRTGGA